MRAQLVVAVAVGLMLVAVPLYLWRRPTVAIQSGSPSASEASNVAVSVAAKVLSEPKVARAVQASVTIEPVVRVGCGSAANRLTADAALCDRQPFFEAALSQAIKDSSACVPKGSKAGSINHVLTVDFTTRRLHVFPGKSGDWKGPSARKVTDCVTRALPKADMTAMVHKYRFYVIAQLVRYPGPAPIPGPADAPLFE